MDYCTHFPEGWWATCCQAHDAAYAAQIGRIEADLGLRHASPAAAEAAP